MSDGWMWPGPEWFDNDHPKGPDGKPATPETLPREIWSRSGGTRAIVTLAGLSAVSAGRRRLHPRRARHRWRWRAARWGLSTPGMWSIDPPPLGTRHGEARALAGGSAARGADVDGGELDGVAGPRATGGPRRGTGRWSRLDPSPFPHGLFSPAAVRRCRGGGSAPSDDETIPASSHPGVPECRGWGPAAAGCGDPTDGPWRRLTAPPLTTDVRRLDSRRPDRCGDGERCLSTSYPPRSTPGIVAMVRGSTVDPPVDRGPMFGRGRVRRSVPAVGGGRSEQPTTRASSCSPSCA